MSIALLYSKEFIATNTAMTADRRLSEEHKR